MAHQWKVVGMAVAGLALSLLPAAAFAAVKNAAISRITIMVSGDTAKATAVHVPGVHVDYQFRVETPPGHWIVARPFAPSASFTWKPPSKTRGTYHVKAEALTTIQVAQKKWSEAVQSNIGTIHDVAPASGVAVLSILGVPTSTISVDTIETLTVEAKNGIGGIIINPGTPKWHISPSSGAMLVLLKTGSVQFLPTTAGTYYVTATLDGKSATVEIPVY